MFKLCIISSVLAVAALGCGDKKSPPPSAKPAEPAVTAPPTPVAGAPRLGPIDLSATTIDLAALFPGTAYVLHPAEDQTGGGSTPDGYQVETAEIRRGDRLLVQAELEGDKIVRLMVYEASLASPAGARAGDSAAQVAKLLPDATCEEHKLVVFCSSAREVGITYNFDNGGLGAEWGTEQPIAKLNADATLGFVEWTPPKGQEPKLAARPTTIAKVEGGDERELDELLSEPPRKPTADEIDRCARLYVITSTCGVGDDIEYGWIPSEMEAVGAAAAKQACDQPSMTTVEGEPTLPVKILEPAKLAKVEAAAKKGCKAVFKTLDKVDPRIGPAGEPPVGED